jgi:anti-sigma B factor antagonist
MAGIEMHGTSALVRLRGELDMETAPSVAALIRSVAPLSDRIVLDLSELSFIDSSGLHLALREHERAEGEGYAFVLAAPLPSVSRTLRLVGLDSYLRIAPDVATALEST